MRKLYALICFLSFPFIINAQIINTIAGTGVAGYTGDGGPANKACLYYPVSVTTDISGNVYISDGLNNCIRKINSSNIITTVAGCGTYGYSGDGGAATLAKLQTPQSLAADKKGNVFVYEYAHIRKINKSGIISTIAGTSVPGFTGDGGPGTAARISVNNTGITVDTIGNVYFCDGNNHRVRRIDTNGVITTIAGSGSSTYSGDGSAATAAGLASLSDITVGIGGNIYVADGVVVRVIKSTGIISKLAGSAPAGGYGGDGGPASAGRFNNIEFLAADTKGNLYINDHGNRSVRKIDASGIITTIAGSRLTSGYSGDGGPATAASFSNLVGIGVDGYQNVYVADYSDERVRVIFGKNHPPLFAAGRKQTIGFCQNSVGNSINKQLSVIDSDIHQLERWSVVTPPVNGTLVGIDTVPSTGTVAVPTKLSYTPTLGYLGNDSFIVRVTDGQQYDTTKVYVSVTTTPAVITGNYNVCMGGVSTLSDSTLSAVWSSSNTAIADINPTSGVVTGVATGTATISYSLGTSCRSVHAVTINPSPSAISGVTAFCSGASGKLVSSGSGAWASRDTSVAVASPTTGIVSGRMAGTATITYSLSFGCSDSTVVTVWQTPSLITGNTMACVGYPSVLNDSVAGGGWTSGNTLIATIGTSSGMVSGVTTGTAVITYKMTTGCATTGTVTVDMVPAITGVTSVCLGLTTTLSNTMAGGVWSSANTSIATVGVASGICSGIGAGTTTITYTRPSGCYQQATLTVYAAPPAITGIDSVCAGSATTLSNSFVGGTWSSGDPTKATIGAMSGMLNGVAAGTATITYTIGGGCLTTTSVTVDPLPAAMPGGYVCTGSSITLSDATTGGAWTSDNTLTGTITAISGILTGVAVGTTTITYMIPTGCFVTAKATVNPLPTAISGAMSICAGSSSALSCATGGGSWTSGNTAVATISYSGVVSGVTTGTAIIIYKLAGTGCEQSSIMTITSAPSAISGSGKICAGSVTSLSDAVTGGSWTSANTAVATADPVTGQVSGISQGTAAITYSLGGGCTSSTVVTVYPVAPVTGPSGVCAGQKVSLSDALTGGAWSSGATAIATVDPVTGKVTGVSAGGVTISYTAPSGCYSARAFTVSSAVGPIAGPTGICNGGAATFSDPSTGGVWSSGNTSVLKINIASGMASALTNGVSVLTYSLGIGCVAMTSVTVNPMPGPISGGTRVCVGGALRLSDATTGGLWTAPGTSVSVGLGSGIVTALSGGAATVSYAFSTGCGVAYTVNVDTLPASISGPNRVCAGGMVTLSDATTGGSWSTAATTVTIAGSTGDVNALRAGAATITYTSMAGCVINSVFTVDPLPAPISGSPGVCIGLSTLLTDASVGGTWSSGDTMIVKADAITGKMTGRAVGSATINYTLPTGCFISAPLVVHGVAPITGATLVCPGNTISLANTIGGGTWSSGATAMATAGSSTGVVTGVAAGTATISYVTSYGCASSTVVTVHPWLYPGVITGTSTACPGYIVALSDTVSGGVWSSADANVYVPPVGGTVRGISAGTAVITYGVANICGTAMALYPITIFPAPSTHVIHSADSACEGATMVATASAPGGVWTTISSNITISPMSGMVSAISAGPANITYTFVNVCGAEVDIHAVKVNPLPVAGVIMGAAHVCVGATALFLDSEPGGAWSVSNKNASISSGLVSGISPGNDTLLYTTTNSCGVADTFYPVTIDPLPNAGILSGADSVCIGAATAESSAITGGVWVSDNTSVLTVGSFTGIANGMSVGTATLTYSVSTLCGTDQNTKLLKVNTLPDAGAITCADTICEGRVTLLKSVVKGGAWSNRYNTISAISSDTLIGISAGIDTVVYTVTNVCGTSAAAHPVRVAPSPWAGSIDGGGVLCVGNVISLSNAAVDGIWSVSAPGVAAITNGSVTAISPGTDTVFYSVTNSCGTATAWTTMDIANAPSVAPVSGSGNVCVGATITLANPTTGGAWSCLNDKAMVTDGVVTGKTAGNTIIRYSASNECGTSYADIAVYVDQAPSAGVVSVVDSLCEGDSLSISASVGNGVWSVSNDRALRLGVGTIVGLASGSDTVIYTVTNACGSSSATHLVKVRSGKECSGAVKHSFDCVGNGEVFIYPNPNPGLFTINVVSDITEHIQVEIFDLWGQKVADFTQQTNNPRQIRLSQPRGVYIVSINGAHGHCSKRLVIDK